MRYSVPQFIDVEDKIVGPLTLKQFGYVAGGVGLIFFFWLIFGFTVLFFILSFPVVIVFGALAFLKVNGRPFQYFLLAFLKFSLGGQRVWMWRRTGDPQPIAISMKEKTELEKQVQAGRQFPKSNIQKIVEVLDTGMSTQASSDIEMMAVAQRVRTRSDKLA